MWIPLVSPSEFCPSPNCSPINPSRPSKILQPEIVPTGLNPSLPMVFSGNATCPERPSRKNHPREHSGYTTCPESSNRVSQPGTLSGNAPCPMTLWPNNPGSLRVRRESRECYFLGSLRVRRVSRVCFSPGTLRLRHVSRVTPTERLPGYRPATPRVTYRPSREQNLFFAYFRKFQKMIRTSKIHRNSRF